MSNISEVTYRLKLSVPLRLRVELRELPRDEFFEWVWRRLAAHELLGVHEGTLLSEEAAREGHTTESWTLDAAEAPRERDWVSDRSITEAELYFGSDKGAQAGRLILEKEVQGKGYQVGQPELQAAQDWDAEWKASFLNAGQGVCIPPFWRVIPPWTDPAQFKEQCLKINPGAGFGTGTHETTQLCLEAIGEAIRGATGCPSPRLAPAYRALDFGSGSGILSIGAALLGAQVDAVEIDPLANENAAENASLNQVSDRVSISLDFARAPAQACGPYPLVIANILRPVLVQFAEDLVSRMDPRQGVLILSGLIDSDVPLIIAAFSPFLKKAGITTEPQVAELGEWRRVVWKA